MYDSLVPRSFPSTARLTFGLHRLHLIIAFIISFTLLLFVINRDPVQTHQRYQAQPPDIDEQKATLRPLPPPPKYEELREWEDNLPQHNFDLPYPEGRTGRYVKFSNQIVMLGWNNVFSEALMNAHLAYASNRSYVFQDYVWQPDHVPFPRSEWLEDPPRTPLGALIAGSVVGGPWDTERASDFQDRRHQTRPCMETRDRDFRRMGETFR